MKYSTYRKLMKGMCDKARDEGMSLEEATNMVSNFYAKLNPGSHMMAWMYSCWESLLFKMRILDEETGEYKWKK